MTPDLSRRLAAAFAAGAATPAEREQLRTAAGPPEVQSAADLPDEARQLLANLETRGRSDVPAASDEDEAALGRLHARRRLTMDYPVDVHLPTG